MIDQALETTEEVSQPIITPFTDVAVKTDGTFVVTLNGNRSHVTQDYNPPLYQAVRQYLDNGGTSSEYAEDIIVQSDLGLLAKLRIESSLKASEKLVSEYRDARDLGGALPITTEQFTQLLTWRQAVREWPQVPGYPDEASQPVTPGWIEAVVLDGE
jgi:2-phospho-L-lactate guanylyltransferase (CobY/MobA/RfbA family)